MSNTTKKIDIFPIERNLINKVADPNARELFARMCDFLETIEYVDETEEAQMEDN